MTTATLPVLAGAPTALPPLCHVLDPGTFRPLCGAQRTPQPIHHVQRCRDEGHGICNVCTELARSPRD